MPRRKLAQVREFRPPAQPSTATEAFHPNRERLSHREQRGSRTSRRAIHSADLRGHIVDYAFKNLDRFASLEPKVLQGDDSKAIHDLRVATRRLQTSMDLLFGKQRPAQYRKLRRRLKKCRRILSEVRNCDAMTARAESALGRKRTARREVWTSFREYLADRRPKSFSKAVRKLSKASMAPLYLQLKRLLAQTAQEREGRMPPQQSGDAGEAGGFEAKIIVRLEDARQAFEKRLDACLANPGAQASHQVRIAAKRLRYLLEILHACGIPSSSGPLLWFRNIQTHLGDLHDTDILEEKLIEMTGRPKYLREHLERAIQTAKLILQIRCRKQILLHRFIRNMSDSGEYEQARNWLMGLPEYLSPSGFGT